MSMEKDRERYQKSKENMSLKILLFEVIAREQVDTQRALVREQVSTQDMLAREHARHVRT